jgi:predicted ATP-dependent endonuclease of OLD family
LGLATHILNEKEKRLFLIDEPQTFLHPHAETELLQLIADSGHQFLVATHSAAFINASRSSLVLLSKKDDQTFVRDWTESGISELIEIAKELGLPMNHLLAGKGVVWLEGKTEIGVLDALRKFDSVFDLKCQNVNFVALPDTGMVSGHKVGRITNAIADTYSKKLGIPFCVLIDGENRKEAEVKHLKDVFGERLLLLPAKEIESYLLHAESVVTLLEELVEELGLEQQIPSVETVKSLFQQYVDQMSPSKVLNKVFNELCSIEYDKIKHGVRLVNCILAKDNKRLIELQAFFESGLNLLK